MSANEQCQTVGEPRAEDNAKLAEPRRYRVFLHNDDYTSMDFVVGILQAVFHKQLEDARNIMLAVHKTGIGQCGIYTKEVAEAKVSRVHREARNAGFPLKCSMERV